MTETKAGRGLPVTPHGAPAAVSGDGATAGRLSPCHLPSFARERSSAGRRAPPATRHRRRPLPLRRRPGTQHRRPRTSPPHLPLRPLHVCHSGEGARAPCSGIHPPLHRVLDGPAGSSDPRGSGAREPAVRGFADRPRRGGPPRRGQRRPPQSPSHCAFPAHALQSSSWTGPPHSDRSRPHPPTLPPYTCLRGPSSPTL